MRHLSLQSTGSLSAVGLVCCGLRCADNNEWLVLDWKQFTPGTAPSPNTLWIIDQVRMAIVAQ